MQRTAQSQLALAVYRSLAELSARGKNLDVVPWQALHAASAASGECVTEVLRKCERPAGVMAAMRNAFATSNPPLLPEGAANWRDPLAVLKSTVTLTHALRPTTPLPAMMPALIEERCLLPGERARFVFSELEAHELVIEAMKAGDRRFVHLMQRPGVSSQPADVEAASVADDAVGCVVTILNAKDLSYGRLAVEGIAGPRCKITDRRRDAVDGGENSGLLRVTPSLFCDEPLPEDATCELRRGLASKLLRPEVAPLLGLCAMVPPLLDAERLSHYVAGLVLHADDADLRIAALYSTNTLERLAFCAQEMRSSTWDALVAHATPIETAGGQGDSRPWERDDAEDAQNRKRRSITSSV